MSISGSVNLSPITVIDDIKKGVRPKLLGNTGEVLLYIWARPHYCIKTVLFSNEDL